VSMSPDSKGRSRAPVLFALPTATRRPALARRPACARRSSLALLTVSLLLPTALLLPAAATAQPGGRPIPFARLLDTRTFEADLRFISDDLTEGRAPAGRGEAITVAYIEARLRMAGAEGAFPGGVYRQAVPLVRQKASPDMPLNVSGPGGRRSFTYGTEFVIDSGVHAPTVEASGEIVFVGYGIEAPEYRWDDYGGSDLRGKVLMMLVNDPPATAEEPGLFEGEAMTYYGRWTYKYEIAEQKGAAGVLLVHVADMAGYGWNVVASSWSGDQFSLEESGSANPLKMRGWVQQDVARTIAGLAGQDLDRLMERARSRDFRPVPFGVEASILIRNETERMTGWNVVGMVRGSDAQRAGECVLYTAHLDHLGMRAGEGDVIYNGCYDNASGVSAVLNLADALGSIPAEQRPGRSFLFGLVTAEESGLLGSRHLAEHPPVPTRDIVAAINLDGVNLWGPTDDLVLLGGDRTGLWGVLQDVAAPLGMTVKSDPNPNVGSFFRSDHFSFAKVGIPASSLSAGDTYRGRPEGWGKTFRDRWTAETYHQPSDEFSTDYVYDGALQVMTAALAAGLRIASGSDWIKWKEGDPFGRIRAADRAGR
jgi:Zn-dependent M28 family amino/carboxypeptidase